MPEENSALLSPALSELAGLLLSTASFTELVQEVAELTVRTVAPATTCGVTLAEQGRVFTVAAADELAGELDEQQYELGDGPCLQALASGEVVDAPESRWAAYPSTAMSHGIQAVHSVPLMVEGKPVGVLNVYASNPNSFRAVDRQLLGLLAGQAAIAVTAALRHYDEVTLSDRLSTRPSGSSWPTNAAPQTRLSWPCVPSPSDATSNYGWWPPSWSRPPGAPNPHPIPTGGLKRSLGWSLPRSFGSGVGSELVGPSAVQIIVPGQRCFRPVLCLQPGPSSEPGRRVDVSGDRSERRWAASGLRLRGLH